MSCAHLAPDATLCIHTELHVVSHPCLLLHLALCQSQVIAAYPNVCQQLHMPAQSGSTSCLERMRRGYSREAYEELVDRVRAVLQPNVALSTDIIAGVPTSRNA